MDKKWYIAVLVISSNVNKTLKELEPLIDLQFRLIRASDPEAAYQTVMEIGRAEHHVYKNEDGKDVEWIFQGLNDLRELDEKKIVSGMEVYSRILRADSGELVVPKEELTVFWYEQTKDKTAEEILEEK